MVDTLQLLVRDIYLYSNVLSCVTMCYLAGMDYTPINQTVTLGPGNTLEEITISVLDDVFTESNETVCVRVILPESSQAVGVLLNSSHVNFTIVDSNGK